MFAFDYGIFDMEEEDARYGQYCKICGAVIRDRKAHSEWHRKVTVPAETKDSDRRCIFTGYGNCEGIVKRFEFVKKPFSLCAKHAWDMFWLLKEEGF